MPVCYRCYWKFSPPLVPLHGDYVCLIPFATTFDYLRSSCRFTCRSACARITITLFAVDTLLLFYYLVPFTTFPFYDFPD